MTSKKTRATVSSASKFSGLLNQARTREEPDIIEDQASLDVGERSAESASSSDISSAPSEAVPQQAIPNAAGAGRGRGKRSNPDFTQITAYIRVETHQEVKAELLREAAERAKSGERGAKPRELSEIVEDVLRNWLSERKS